MYKYIVNVEDRQKLQRDINKIVEWLNTNLLSINVDKCKVVSFGRNVDISHTYAMNGIPLQKDDFVRDVGVYFDSKLSFDAHINEKINKANSILGLIKRNFTSLSHEAFLSIYKALVRSHLEYAVSIWNPYKKEFIEKLEKIQMRATKLLPDLRKLPYVDRLKKLKLPTLKYRRIRGDIIELYKIINNFYDSETTIELTYAPYACTRGNRFKLFSQHSRYELRKHFFINRVTNIWNSLPNKVTSAPNLNAFKNQLDKFWANQEIVYDWQVDITGAGNRSFE